MRKHADRREHFREPNRRDNLLPAPPRTTPKLLDLARPRTISCGYTLENWFQKTAIATDGRPVPVSQRLLHRALGFRSNQLNSPNEPASSLPRSSFPPE